MFGIGKGNDSDERAWNLLICNMYATDKEIEKMIPAILVVIILFIFGIVIFDQCITKIDKEEQDKASVEQTR